MLLSLVVHLQSMRWMVPAAVMLGNSPQNSLICIANSVLTFLLPGKYFIKSDDALYSLYQRFILFFFEHYTGTELILYGDAADVLKKRENVIFLANHQSTVDWIVADMLAIRQGSLGSLRYVVKDGLKYFPFYGWRLQQHSTVFVKRGGGFNPGKMTKQLVSMKKNKVPMWLVIFPEGTRYNPANTQAISRSRAFSDMQGYPPLDYVLVPRHKATYLSIDALRDYVDAVYDVTTAYSNTWDNEEDKRIEAPGMPDFLCGASPEVHVHIKRIKLEEIPQEEQDIKDWLQERYQEKDKLLQRFYKEDGKLGDDGTISKLPLYHTIPATLFNVLITLPFYMRSEGRRDHLSMWIVGTIACAAWAGLRA